MRWGSIISVLILIACGPIRIAQAQSDPAAPWDAYLFEVTYIDRQDPPVRLVERRDELRTSLGESDEKQRSRVEQQLARLDDQIARETGYILAGWGTKVGRDGLKADSSTSMIAFIVEPARANNETAAGLGPGDLVLAPKRSLRDLFTSGGRRYWHARRIKAAERPNWWHAPTMPATVPEPTPDRVAGVESALRFQRIKENRDRRTYRYTLSLEVTGVPASVQSLELAVHVRPRTKQGRALGPILELVSLDRSEKGTFGVHRSWEINLPAGVELDADNVTAEVFAVSYDSD